MDGPRDYHTQRSESEKNKLHMIPLICGILKMMQKNLRMKQYRLGVWDEHIHTAVYKIDNEQGSTV